MHAHTHVLSLSLSHTQTHHTALTDLLSERSKPIHGKCQFHLSVRSSHITLLSQMCEFLPHFHCFLTLWPATALLFFYWFLNILNQWHILYTADCSKICLCMNCTEAYKCYHCWSPWSAKEFDFCPLFEHCNQHRQHISIPRPNAAHQLVSTCPNLQNLPVWLPPSHFNMQHNYLGIRLFWIHSDPPMYIITKCYIECAVV
jgi:hypothetical protein